MDYTVGSLADLISGSNTPNKPKVIKTKFTPEISKKLKVKGSPKQSKKPKNDIIPDDLSSENEKGKSKKKNKKKKTIDNQLVISESISENNEIESISENNDIESKKKKKKRKLDSNEDLADSGDEIPVKKTKPSENDQNAERRVKKKLKEEKKVYDPEELARTIFVGNVPINTNKKVMKKHFKKYGSIESLRFRGIPVADPKVSKKVAAIKKEFHPDRNTVFCYIRFINKEDAIKAEAENGALFEEHHLRVHTCGSENKPDESKAIFVGNLSFNAEEEELWKLFEPCGPISHVRIIRDGRTGMGKGFAYVNFQGSDAVQLALEMENVKLKNRELRIALSNLTTAKKNKKRNKTKLITKPGNPNFKKPWDKNKGSSEGQKTFGKQKWTDKKGSQEKPRFKKPFNKQKSDGDNTSENPGGQSWVKDKGFQGSKFNDKKKKHKINKGDLEKKRKVKKIAPHVK